MLSIDTSVDDSFAILTLVGDLDLTTVDDMRAAVDAVLNAGARQVGFGCQELSFVDSSGLRGFLDAQAKTSAVGLLQPSPALKRLLEITSLDTVLPVFDDVAAMRAHFDESAPPANAEESG